MDIPWVLISILVLGLVAVALLAIFAKKADKRKVDYRHFFVIGLIELAFGLSYLLLSGNPFGLNGLTATGFFFTVQGLIFTVLGLAHKDKWGKKVEAPLTKNQKRILVGLTLLIALLAVLTSLLSQAMV